MVGRVVRAIVDERYMMVRAIKKFSYKIRGRGEDGCDSGVGVDDH